MKKLLALLLCLILCLSLFACNASKEPTETQTETEHSNIPEEFVFPQISQYDSVIESEEERQALYEKYVNFPQNYKSVIRFFATWKTENLWNSVSRRSPFGFLVTEETTKDGVTETTTKLYTEKSDSAGYEFPLRGEELYTKYALNPEDVFSESVTVYNTYCKEKRSRIAKYSLVANVGTGGDSRISPYRRGIYANDRRFTASPRV